MFYFRLEFVYLLLSSHFLFIIIAEVIGVGQLVNKING